MSLAPLPNGFELDLHSGRLPSGLHLRVEARPHRRTGFCALGVDFGSIDRDLGKDGGPVPSGTAHFLEHELFEDEAGDVSDRFAAMGASTNAMTGFVGTTYVASTTGDMLPTLKLLLEFVQHPVFDAERIDRERGVIAQEIRMYDDDPDWRAFAGLLECLYARHPVRDNIAGTVKTIAEIDAEVLTRCHAAAYRPDNLCLAVSGPVDPAAVLALAEADQDGRPSSAETSVTRDDAGESPAAASPSIELALPVERPRLLLGIKESVLGGGPLVVARRQLTTRMLLDVLFGRSSAAFESLYGDGLIDETFSASHSAEAGFGFTMLGGETDDPLALEERLRRVLADARRDGVDAAAHGRIRNKLYGSLMRALDQPETVAYGLVSSCFRHMQPFSALGLVESVSVDDLMDRLHEHVRDDAFASAVVRPA